MPTSEKSYDEDRESLMKRLQDLWAELESRGIERGKLLAGTIITPACGTGLLEPELAVRIYRLAREVSDAVREMTLVK